MSRDDPRYADYYAIKDRQDAIVANGGCSCCASKSDCEPGTAQYRWEHTNGYISYLCEWCCQLWREFAQEDPALLPRQVRSLRSNDTSVT